MKPNFALTLSFDGLRLLHRAAGGWRVVGDVTFGSADLDRELAALRKTAAAIEPAGVRCKLLIPNEQIKYLTIPAEGMDGPAREAAARAALAGATPYAVEDLVYDTSPDGPRTHIAAVARETLAEAEAFALEHRFNPVSFAAVPGDQPFLGEPYFGQTKAAGNILDEGESVVPDGIAVVVIGDVEIPEGPVARVNDPMLNPGSATAPPPAARPAKAPEPVEAETLVKPLPPAKPRPAPEPEPEAAPDAKVAGFAENQAPGPDRPVKLPPLQDVPGPAPALGFASRRAPPAQTAALGGARREPVEAAAPARASPNLASRAAPPAGKAPKADAPEPAAGPEAEPTAPPVRRAAAPAPVAAAGSIPCAVPAAIPAMRAAAPAKAAAATETDPMKMPGAPGGSATGGKPRFLGLILTVILLIFLAGVAAWASIYLQDGIAGLFNRGAPVAAEAETQADSTEDDERAADAAEEMEGETGGIVTASLDAGLTDEDAAVLDALRDPDQPVAETPPTPEETEAQYAVTGIWPVAPDAPAAPAMVSLDDLYLTGIDPISPALDAVALPDVAKQDTDAAISPPNSPTLPGTAFKLDPQGLVIPTPEGVVNPDGITVYLGRPPLTPPDTRAPEAPAPDVAAGLSALAERRPQLRPEGLIESNERATLDGLTRNELSGLRPKLRPQSAQENALAAASLVPLDAPAAEPADSFADASAQATAASRRPDVRPKGFARIVERAAREEPKPKAEERVAAATVAPRTVAPSVPSSASVSREATVANAINLRKVNLIGVYGKPSDRRALVRLSNGRYQKVQVGDRIDGGRVSAIGDSELRYQKSGRNIILTMPKG